MVSAFLSAAASKPSNQLVADFAVDAAFTSSEDEGDKDTVDIAFVSSCFFVPGETAADFFFLAFLSLFAGFARQNVPVLALFSEHRSRRPQPRRRLRSMTRSLEGERSAEDDARARGNIFVSYLFVIKKMEYEEIDLENKQVFTKLAQVFYSSVRVV
jgi:hypothetical protein